MAANHQTLRGAFDDLPFRGDRGGFEKADQLGERVVAAIVRGRRGEDQRIRVRGEQACELIVLGRLISDVVGLVDDHRVPAVMP